MSAVTAVPDDRPDDENLAARARVAAAVRRLGHAIVGHEVPDDVLHDLAADLESRLEPIEAGAPRRRTIQALKREVWHRGPAEGERVATFHDCIVSGDANPLGMAVTFYRRGDQAVAHVNLGAAFEGAPARAHGGVVAAIFDDLMGIVLFIVGSPAYTGELTVRYHAPTPVGEDIEFRAWLRDRDGRKLYVDAEATHRGQVIATASAVFIAMVREATP